MADRESKHIAKPQYSFLAELVEYFPRETLERAMVVFKSGEAKYGKDNWKTPPYLSKEEITDSLLRHLFKCIKDPYATDANSGLHHSIHVLINAIFLDAYVSNGWLEESPVCRPIADKEPPPVDTNVSLAAQHVKSLLERKLEQVKLETKANPVRIVKPIPEESNRPIDKELSSILSEFNPDDFSQFIDLDE